MRAFAISSHGKFSNSTQWLKFNTINFYTVSSRALFAGSVWGPKNAVNSNTVGIAKAATIFLNLPLLLHHQCKCPCSEKGKYPFSLIVKRILTLRTPIRVWGFPRGPQTTVLEELLYSILVQEYTTTYIYCCSTFVMFCFELLQREVIRTTLPMSLGSCVHAFALDVLKGRAAGSQGCACSSLVNYAE